MLLLLGLLLLILRLLILQLRLGVGARRKLRSVFDKLLWVFFFQKLCKVWLSSTWTVVQL